MKCFRSLKTTCVYTQIQCNKRIRTCKSSNNKTTWFITVVEEQKLNQWKPSLQTALLLMKCWITNQDLSSITVNQSTVMYYLMTFMSDLKFDKMWSRIFRLNICNLQIILVQIEEVEFCYMNVFDVNSDMNYFWVMMCEWGTWIMSWYVLFVNLMLSRRIR